MKPETLAAFRTSIYGSAISVPRQDEILSLVSKYEEVLTLKADLDLVNPEQLRFINAALPRLNESLDSKLFKSLEVECKEMSDAVAEINCLLEPYFRTRGKLHAGGRYFKLLAVRREIERVFKNLDEWRKLDLNPALGHGPRRVVDHKIDVLRGHLKIQVDGLQQSLSPWKRGQLNGVLIDSTLETMREYEAPEYQSRATWKSGDYRKFKQNAKVFLDCIETLLVRSPAWESWGLDLYHLGSDLVNRANTWGSLLPKVKSGPITANSGRRREIVVSSQLFPGTLGFFHETASVANKALDLQKTLDLPAAKAR